MPFRITPELSADAQAITAQWADPANPTTIVIVPHGVDLGDAQWDDPTDTTVVRVVPTGKSDSFAIVPAPPPMLRDTDTFIQWQSGGYDLGDNKVLVVNFRYPLIATRGVGEHENVITVGRAKAPPPPPPPPPPSVYYTSIIYPLITEDAMHIPLGVQQRGTFLTIQIDPMDVAVPALESGTLTVTISFLTYDNSLLFPDNSQVFVPVLESGTLVVTITFVTYDARPFPDNSQVPVPTLQSGTLVVVITYITYDNTLIYPDNSQIFVPTLQSGTLV